jgi:hypothetical protein
VFSYVGIGDYFYTAAVCSTWRKRYLKLCYSAAATSKTTQNVNKHRTSQHSATVAAAAAKHRCTTFYKSASMTVARLQLTLKDSVTVAALQAHKRRRTREIVYYSLDSAGVLSLLKLHNWGWYANLCTYAAYKGKLPLLQWLHDGGCP